MTGERAHPFEHLWDYADPVKSEAAFRACLRESDLPRPVRAELLSQISRACCLQRRHADAQRALDEATALLEPGASRSRVRCLLEQGRLWNEMEMRQRCVSCFEDAWAMACACGEDFHAVDAAHMLGYVLGGDDSVHWHEVGLARARESSDARTRRWLFRLCVNLGKKYADMGRTDRALSVLAEALAVCEEQGLPAERRRDVRWNVAYAHRRAGDVEAAERLQRELEAEIAAAGAPPDGYVFEELAECLLALGREEEARPYFARAWELHRKDPWFPPTELARLERIRGLAGRA